MIETKALRKKILEIAFSGKLSSSVDVKETSGYLIRRIAQEKERLVKDKVISKNKSLSPIKDDEKIFLIPNEWEYIKLGMISLPLSDGVHYAPEYQKDGYKCFSAKDIFNNKINDSNCTFISEEEYFGMKDKINVRKGSILITKSGSIGRSTVVKDYFEFGLVESIGVINPIIMNPEYIKYVLDYGFVYSSYYFDKYTRGVGLKHLTLSLLENIPIPVPSLKEQESIVKQLDSVFNQLDIIDNYQEAYSNDLAVLKSKIIDAGIRGKLTEQLPEDGSAKTLYAQIQEEKAKLVKEGKIKREKPLPEITDEEIPFEIPSNWKWVRLNDIASKISSGNTPQGGKKANVYVENGNCFFREQNVYNDGIHYDGMVYITDELLSTRKNSTVVSKDILLNITGGSIGRCTLIPDDFDKGSINQHILIIRMVDERLRFYIHRLLCSPYIQKQIKNKSVGDKEGLSAGRCKQMLIPLPPYNEQIRISNVIDEALNMIG